MFSNYPYIFLIGGGGKTTLMFQLAREFVAKGKTVITTTSTKIAYPDSTQSGCVITGDVPGVLELVKKEIISHQHMTVGLACVQSERKKLIGFDAVELDAIHDAQIADYLIVEADGSKGRSLKAHLSHEPVLASMAALVIVVIGMDVIGKPANEEFVHRSNLFCERLGKAPGALVTVDDVVGILFHPEGYLAKVGPKSEVIVFLSKVDNATDQTQALILREIITKNDPGQRIKAIMTMPFR